MVTARSLTSFTRKLCFTQGRVIPTVSANGSPAFGQYKPNEAGDGYEPWALQVLELAEGRIVELTFFLDTARLFPLFGLPLKFESQDSSKAG